MLEIGQYGEDTEKVCGLLLLAHPVDLHKLLTDHSATATHGVSNKHEILYTHIIHGV